MSSGNGRILTPNAVNVAAQFQPGPLASPVAVTLQGPGQVQVIAIGGLTKVEQLAGMIYGKSPESGPFTVETRAAKAVDAAEAIIAECERREKERQVANGIQ